MVRTENVGISCLSRADPGAFLRLPGCCEKPRLMVCYAMKRYTMEKIESS